MSPRQGFIVFIVVGGICWLSYLPNISDSNIPQGIRNSALEKGEDLTLSSRFVGI